MKYQSLAATLALVLVSACSACTAAPPSAPATPEISRADAVTEARQDARAHFNFTSAGVVATRSGQFWLVDLRTTDGAQAHYAIGVDGSIRERRLLP